MCLFDVIIHLARYRLCKIAGIGSSAFHNQAKCLRRLNQEKINVLGRRYYDNIISHIHSLWYIKMYLIRRMVVFLRSLYIHPQCNSNNRILQQHMKAEHTLLDCWQGILHAHHDLCNRTSPWFLHYNEYRLGIPLHHQNQLVSTKGKGHLPNVKLIKKGNDLYWFILGVMRKIQIF